MDSRTVIFFVIGFLFTSTQEIQSISIQNTSYGSIVTGEDYPDALAISAFASSNGWPILFTKEQSISANVQEFLAEIRYSDENDR